MKSISLFVLLVTTVFAVNSQDCRYVRTIFLSSSVTANVVYGTADFLNSPFNDESSTTTGNLVMDIYRPAGDSFTYRPAIIFAHGGGFSTGNRNVDDMEAFCDTFARKGYVTATIDYRQGVEVVDNGNLHYARSAYRGLQDGRAAVRFLRANAATYGIDSSKIYFAGNSAGSFIGLNSIYMDADEKPSYANAVNYTISIIPYSGPDLGTLDIGNNLEHNGEPDAVLACWGGVGDTLTIENDNNQPVFLIHGTADVIVPFNSGAPFNLSGISAVYGSNSINTRLDNIGLEVASTYFAEGEDHEFYGVDNGNWENGTGGNQYWDTVVIMAADFFWQQHKPTADFTFQVNDLSVDFNDQSSSDANAWYWDFGDGDTIMQQNPTHTYSSGGQYEVTLYIENLDLSWDEITKTISVDESAKTETLQPFGISIYPNPTSGIVNLDFTYNHVERITIYDISGKMLVEKTNVEQNETVDLSDYENQMYMIRIQTDKKVFSIKMVKE